MPYFRKLVGEKCFLSPVDEDSAPYWTAWDNDLDITIPLGDEAYTPISLLRTRESLRSAILGQHHDFDIVDCASYQPVGRCILFGIDFVNRSAMLGIVIGEKSYQGKGYGDEAMRLLIDYAFNLLNLNSLMLGVFAFNQRALNLYRKLGFKEIGRRRQARLIAGKAYDVILMDLLANEFESFYIKKIVEKTS